MLAVLISAIASCSCGLLPALPAAYITPYATSYTASVVNHHVAAPVIAAAPARFVSPARLVAPVPVAYKSYLSAYSAPLVIGK